MAELPFDWQQRIQKQEGPTTLALGDQAYVETKDPRYLSDAYQYYMQGMDRAAAPSGITAATAAPVVQDPTTMIPQTGGGAGITGASVVQPTVSDPFLASGAAGGARLPTMDQAGAVAAMTPDAAYSLPGQSDPFLASGAAGGARLPTTPPIRGASGDLYAPGDLSILEKEDDYQDPNFIGRLQNTFNTEGLSGVIENFGQGAADIISGLKDKGIDVGKMAVGALMNAIQPGLGLAAHLIPETTPIDRFYNQYQVGGDFYEDIVEGDPGLEGRLEGYSNTLQAGNISQDPFGINTTSALGDYPAYATDTYNKMVDKEKTGKELSQFDKDRKEYYGHISGLTGETNIPGTPLMVDDSPLKTFPEGDIDIIPPEKPIDDFDFQTRFKTKDEDDKWVGPGELKGGLKTPTDVGSPFDYMQPDYELEQTATDYAKDYLDKDIAETDLEGINIKGRDFEGDLTSYLDQEPTVTGIKGPPSELVSDFGEDIDIEQGFVGTDTVEEATGGDVTMQEMKDLVESGNLEQVDRTDANVAKAVDVLAEQYDQQRGPHEDPTTTSNVNKAKAQINMPQQLGDAGQGSPMGGPTGAPTGISGPPSRGGTATTGPSAPPGQGGGGGGGGKIVCTMMNDSYGFGSFRNKIWLRQSKNLAPEYQIGYHKIFLPLVKLSNKNIVLKKVLEHIAIHRTIDIRQEARGKRHLLGRIYRRILEPLCYWVGRNVKR